jgi:hypothetical protein
VLLPLLREAGKPKSTAIFVTESLEDCLPRQTGLQAAAQNPSSESRASVDLTVTLGLLDNKHSKLKNVMNFQSVLRRPISTMSASAAKVSPFTQAVVTAMRKL